MDIKVEVTYTDRFGTTMTGISSIANIENHVYEWEVDNIIYHCKKAIIACGFSPTIVNTALKESEELS